MKREYNSKATAFDVAAAELSALVQQYTCVRLAQAEQSSGTDHAVNERIIAELNQEEPHHLGEDFTYLRPQGYVFAGRATTGVTTWSRLYELVLQQIYDRDAERVLRLCNDSEFLTSRGNPTLSTNAARLRRPLEFRPGGFVESNLSANGIRDVVRRVLLAVDCPLDQLRIYLRKIGMPTILPTPDGQTECSHYQAK